MEIECKCGQITALKCINKVCNKCCDSILCERYLKNKKSNSDYSFESDEELIEYTSKEIGLFLNELKSTYFSKLPKEINFLIGEFATIIDQKQCGICEYYKDEYKYMLCCSNCSYVYCINCIKFRQINYNCPYSDSCYYCSKGFMYGNVCWNIRSDILCNDCWISESNLIKIDKDEWELSELETYEKLYN